MNETKNIESAIDRLDRLPLKVVFFLMMQTAGIVWWAARLDTRLALMEQRVTEFISAQSVAIDDDRRRSDENKDAIELLKNRVTKLETRNESSDNHNREVTSRRKY